MLKLQKITLILTLLILLAYAGHTQNSPDTGRTSVPDKDLRHGLVVINNLREDTSVKAMQIMALRDRVTSMEQELEIFTKLVEQYKNLKATADSLVRNYVLINDLQGLQLKQDARKLKWANVKPWIVGAAGVAAVIITASLKK